MANYSQTHWSHPLIVKPELGIAVLKAFKKVAIANVLGLSRQGVQKRLFSPLDLHATCVMSFCCAQMPVHPKNTKMVSGDPFGKPNHNLGQGMIMCFLSNRRCHCRLHLTQLAAKCLKQSYWVCRIVPIPWHDCCHFRIQKSKPQVSEGKTCSYDDTQTGPEIRTIHTYQH